MVAALAKDQKSTVWLESLISLLVTRVTPASKLAKAPLSKSSNCTHYGKFFLPLRLVLILN